MAAKKPMKLTIELVPKMLWYANVRSEVSDEVWNRIKQLSREHTGFRCVLCDQDGYYQNFKWPTETHEKWEYDDVNHVQTLVDIQALCPLCHKAKHWGRTMTAESTLMQQRVMNHFQKINNCSLHFMNRYIDSAFITWKERNKYQWTADMDYIYEFLSDDNKSYTKVK